MGGLPVLGKGKLGHSLFQMVTIDSLVPQDHFLRKLDAAVDFSFVRELVEPLYSKSNGRPSIDPELALRMFILSYMYNISENRLCEEICMHAGYRWFCKLDFHDPVPDRTTLVKLRRERWGPAGVFHKIMQHVVSQCVAAGLVSGDAIAIDGTTVQARAASTSLEWIPPELSLVDEHYRPDSETNDTKSGNDDDEPSHGAPSSGRRESMRLVKGTGKDEEADKGEGSLRGKRFNNSTHRSTTDPDARLYRKGLNQGAELRYIVTSGIDPRTGVILRTGASICSGNAEKDAAVAITRELVRRGFPFERALLDGGHDSAQYLADFREMGVEPLVPMKKAPLKAIPTWKTAPKNFLAALRRKRAIRGAIALNEARLRHGGLEYRRTYRLRQRVEHCFAEAKEHHGLRRARGYGLLAMDVQAQLTATVQNLKRLVRLTRRLRPAPKNVTAMAAPTAAPWPEAIARSFFSAQKESVIYIQA